MHHSVTLPLTCRAPPVTACAPTPPPLQVPRLTESHLEAIQCFNEYARSDELRMDYLLQPGEIQLLNNHTMLHSRWAQQCCLLPISSRVPLAGVVRTRLHQD